MIKTLIVCAMNEELAILEKKLNLVKFIENPWIIYKKPDSELYALVSRVGKVHAGAGLSYAITKIQPDQIIGIGVAGGVSPKLKIGDIVICNSSMQHDMDVTAFGYPPGQVPGIEDVFIKSDPKLIEIVESIDTRNYPFLITTGPVMSGDCFVTGDKGIRLHQTYGGLCVDMESAAWAQVAHIYNIPFIVLRSISDQADGNAPENFTEFLEKAVINLSSLVLELIERQ